MIQYLIAPNGRYLNRLEGTATEILAQIPEGHDATILPPPHDTDYWNGSAWVAIGPAPAYYMQFDYDAKGWKDTRDLESTKKTKWEAIKLQRNQLEFGGFEYEGNQYDSDYISQGRILAAVVFGEPTIWTLATDGTIELSKEQLIGLSKALAAHVQAAHARGRVSRELILKASTVEEVDAVNF